MTSSATAGSPGQHVEKAGTSFLEFIALTAALTAITAMSIDIMLPTLPAIGADLGVQAANDRQLVIVVFTIAFAIGQLFFGPLSDRFGRKPMILGGVGVFAVASIAAAFSGDFTTLLVLRAAQGIGTAALRVVAMALVRDCFSGEAMGRVLSFTFTVFMIVPIVAPSVGQIITLLVGWRWIFGILAGFGSALGVWVALRLKETLDPADRLEISFSGLFSALAVIVTNRIAVGYTLASTLTFVGLFGYVVSVQQIYGELYGLGVWFPAVFAATSIGMAITAFTSPKIVHALGMRPVIHWGLVIYSLSGCALYLLALAGTPPLWVTFIAVTISMIAFGILQAQAGALAMEPLGHVAGMASSVIGVFSTTVGAIGGGFIGASYNATVQPLALGFGLSGLLSILVILWTEKGRFFKN